MYDLDVVHLSMPAVVEELAEAEDMDSEQKFN